MNRSAYITTSWDDGHPLDFRVAELLARYELQGTFYIPRLCSTGSMSENQIRELSRSFEVGGHTLNHVDLNTTERAMARSEIADCRRWLQEITGQRAAMFCPPLGHFRREHIEIARLAGFAAMRSVEMLSLAYPRSAGAMQIMPTTLQAFPHAASAYVKNAAKRLASRNLWRAILHCRATDWREMTSSFLPHVLEHGGVFHLWGHSWELEQQGQWHMLEEVLRYLSQFRRQALFLPNSAICDATARPLAA